MQPNGREVEASATRESLLAALKDLRQQFDDGARRLEDPNEATTRLLLVDQILQALGWPLTSFNPEERTGTGFSDYLLKVEGFPRLVVEAKRTGYSFGGKRSRLHRSTYKLAYIKSAFSRPLLEVLTQAETYAQDHGVAFAIVTNGAEWLLFQVIPVFGQKDEDFKCFYFGDVLSDHADIELMWELVSQPSVANGKLEEAFAELSARPASFYADPHERFGDFVWQRVDADELYLQDFYLAFFDEIVDPSRRNMLEHCFVTNTRLDQYEGELKRVLRDTAPSYLRNPEELAPGDTARIVPEIADQRGKVVLVVGSVGCGKSTFVTKVMVDTRRKSGRSAKSHACLVDMINDVEEDSKSTSDAMWSRVHLEWLRSEPGSNNFGALRTYFDLEIKALRNGAFKKVYDQDEAAFVRAEAERLQQLADSPSIFLAKCWRYLRGQGEGLIVFIDNVDRGSELFQRNVYAFAHSLAKETGATVIVPMREMTYYRGTQSGFLDVRSDDIVLHLQVPDLTQLISRRIRYIETHLEHDHRYRAWKSAPGGDVALESFVRYAGILKAALLSTADGAEILAALAALSWHDVRSFLLYVRLLHRALGATAWRLSDMIGAMMTSPDIRTGGTLLPNIYRPPYPNYPCFFLKLRLILLLLHGVGKDDRLRGLPCSRLLAFSRAYGYQDRWTRLAIQELVRERVLECLAAPAAADFTRSYEIDPRDSFRASPLGVVLVGKLATEPAYLGLIGNGLPFHDSDHFAAYVAAVDHVVAIIGESELEQTGLDLLVEARTGSVVATYLVTRAGAEVPLGAVSSLPDVAVTEGRLDGLVDRLTQHAGHPSTSGHTSRDGATRRTGQSVVTSYSQFELDLTNDTTPDASLEPHPVAEASDLIPIPISLEQSAVGTAGYDKLVLWSLVALGKRGFNSARGAQIASTINEHLMHDQNRKHPENVSKALRGRHLASQEWLVTSGSSRDRRFGLSQQWRIAWATYFADCDPPDLGNVESNLTAPEKSDPTGS